MTLQEKNQAPKTKNNQTNSSIAIDLQAEYICYSSPDCISTAVLANKLNECDEYERNYLGYVLRVIKYGGKVCYANTDTFKAHGAGCRAKQKKTREKLQALGLLFYSDRIQWDSPYKLPPLQTVPMFLLDEACAFIVKQFCGLPFFFPLSILKQLKSTPRKPSPVHTITERLKDIILLDSLNSKKEEQRSTMNQEINKKPLKRDSHSDNNKAGTYGGTGLYDRKTSQIEIDLLARSRAQAKRKYGMIDDRSATCFDDEAQPNYNVPRVSAARQQAYPVHSPNTPYVHKEREPEDPVTASQRLIEWTQSEQFLKFEKLFGRDVALKMCNNIVTRAIEEYQE